MLGDQDIKPNIEIIDQRNSRNQDLEVADIVPKNENEQDAASDTDGLKRKSSPVAAATANLKKKKGGDKNDIKDAKLTKVQWLKLKEFCFPGENEIHNEDIEIPWYYCDALPFFPDTLENTASFEVKRDRTLWFLESYSSGLNINFPLPEDGDDVQFHFTGPGKLTVNSVEAFWRHKSLRHQQEPICVEFNATHKFEKICKDVYDSSEHLYFKMCRDRNIDRDTLSGSFTFRKPPLTAMIDGVKQTFTTFLGSNISIIPNQYLKVWLRVEKRVPRLDIYFNTSFLTDLLSSQKYFGIFADFFTQHTRIQLKKPELGNTLEFAPFTPKDGFNLQLYDYQKRSLQWMLQVEDKTTDVSIVRHKETSHFFRFDASSEYLVTFSDRKLVSKPPSSFLEVDYQCRGGILADNPGYGKTITTLALIHSHPLASFSDLEITPVQKYHMFPSRATLIVCPSNLVKQWQAEVQKCMPTSTRCYIVTKILDHRKLTWNSVIQADIVIVSVGFLANKNYAKFLSENYHFDANRDTTVEIDHSRPYFADDMRKTIPDRKKLLNIPGLVNYEAVYWHRIVFDEFHEMDQVERKSRLMAKSFIGNFRWGMTGTPSFLSEQNIKMSADFLGVDFSGHSDSATGRALSFKHKFIRRNNEDLQLPPLHDEIHWVNLTVLETALYNVRNGNEIEAFMACSHYQISDEVCDATGDEVLSISEVTDLLCQRLFQTLENLRDGLEDLSETRKKLQKTIREDNFTDSNARSTAKTQLERNHEKIQDQKDSILLKEREISYFQGVMNAVKNNSLEDLCLICLEEMDSSRALTVTKCGHIFCSGCVKDFFEMPYPPRKLCPKCRQEMKGSEMMNVARSTDVKKERAKEVTAKELEKCGSKVRAMLDRLNALKSENPNSKVILFSQFRRLASIIEQSLIANGVKVVRVNGTAAKRHLAIQEFKSNPECSVIMLSTEDSVSGLHLPEATHVFMAHPFWFGSGQNEKERAISAEKQGIARAYRIGLQHDLHIVRFYTKDTIEETVGKGRSI